jgi:hypothetical protein
MVKSSFWTRNVGLLVGGGVACLAIFCAVLAARQQTRAMTDHIFQTEFAMRLACDDHGQGLTRYLKCVETADAQETTGQDGVREVPIDVSIANPEARAFVQAFVDEYNETMKARIAQSASN